MLSTLALALMGLGGGMFAVEFIQGEPDLSRTPFTRILHLFNRPDFPCSRLADFQHPGLAAARQILISEADMMLHLQRCRGLTYLTARRAGSMYQRESDRGTMLVI